MCVCDLGDTGYVWWVHQSHDLFLLHNSAPNGGGSCLSNSGFEGHRVTKHPATTQATQKY